MKRLVCILIGTWCLAAAPWQPCSAQTEVGPGNGYGLRVGFGIGPDQFVTGVQALLGEQLRVLRLAPSFDFGVGDHVTTYVLNGDLLFNASLPWSQSQLYAGAGPALVVLDPDGGASDTEIGLDLVGGVRLPTNGRATYNIESRFGIGDAPDFRFMVGVLFGNGSAPMSR